MKFHIFRIRKNALIPVSWNYTSQTSSFVKKIHGISFPKTYAYLGDGYSTQFYEQKYWDKVCNYLFKKILKEPKYIPEIYKKQRKAGENLIKLYKKIKKTNLKKKSTNQLFKLYKEIESKWLILDGINVPPWLFGGDLLQQHIYNLLKNKLTDLEIQTLITPSFLSFSMEEERDLLKLLLGKADIKDLVEKYHWIPFGYDGTDLYDEAYYKKQIAENKKSKEEIKKRIAEINNYGEEIKSNQKKILKKISIKKLQKLLSDTSLLAKMTDERKIYHFQIHIALHKILQELSLRLRLSMLEIKHLFLDEIRKKDARKIANERISKPFLLIVKDRKYRFVKGNEFKKITEQILQTSDQTFVKGKTASLSKKPVIGLAKIVLNSKEISKVEKGDILISNMTTPEFVPAMRKAAAIVTDEGGITCHAAIVSRELGIPCIIATGNATKIFKDNDKVEVDTKKGIVRKIKN